MLPTKTLYKGKICVLNYNKPRNMQIGIKSTVRYFYLINQHQKVLLLLYHLFNNQTITFLNVNAIFKRN